MKDVADTTSQMKRKNANAPKQWIMYRPFPVAVLVHLGLMAGSTVAFGSHTGLFSALRGALADIDVFGLLAFSLGAAWASAPFIANLLFSIWWRTADRAQWILIAASVVCGLPGLFYYLLIYQGGEAQGGLMIFAVSIFQSAGSLLAVLIVLIFGKSPAPKNARVT